MKKIETNDEFQQIIQSDEITVIEFFATWCPDCKRLDLFIDEIIEEHNDKIWHKIDRDEFPEIAEKYEVMGIPSLLVFQNGNKIAHLHSAKAKTPEQVREFLNTTQ